MHCSGGDIFLVYFSYLCHMTMQELLKVSHHSPNFCHHGHCGSGDIVVLYYHFVLRPFARSFH